MKIAIVVNSFPETSETFIINKVLALANAGNHVKVIRLNRNGNKALNVLYKFKENKNIEIIDPYIPYTPARLIVSSILKPTLFWSSVSFNRKKFLYQLRKKVFLKLFNNNKFDIVHFEFSGIAVAFNDLLKHIKPRTVLSCRGSAEKVKLLSEPQRAEKLKKAISKIGAVHCVSEDMKTTIAPYCENIEKVFVNRPAIDPFFFLPKKIKHDFNGTVILSVGRFSFQKGYLFGLLAIKQLIDRGHSIQWNIIGEGPQHEEMIFHLHALGLMEHVNLLGKRNKDEVNSWYNKADVFLLTSVYEGIPNVVLEAMAMELPVVTTRSGGVDEVIEHGKDGMIAELYDIQTVANHLQQIINNKAMAEEMGKQARQKIIADYTIDRQLKIFEQQYKALLK